MQHRAALKEKAGRGYTDRQKIRALAFLLQLEPTCVTTGQRSFVLSYLENNSSQTAPGLKEKSRTGRLPPHRLSAGLSRLPTHREHPAVPKSTPGAYLGEHTPWSRAAATHPRGNP